MADTYRVKNKLANQLALSDGQGDEVLVPPLATATVHARFIDFQLPPLQHAEVIGFDYNAYFASKATTSPVTIPDQPEE